MAGTIRLRAYTECYLLSALVSACGQSARPVVANAGSIRSLGGGVLEDLDHFVIEQLGNV
jgi:hypothetical protein